MIAINEKKPSPNKVIECGMLLMMPREQRYGEREGIIYGESKVGEGRGGAEKMKIKKPH